MDEEEEQVDININGYDDKDNDDDSWKDPIGDNSGHVKQVIMIIMLKIVFIIVIIIIIIIIIMGMRRFLEIIQELELRDLPLIGVPFHCVMA